ncbi:MAG: hypothetical protein PHN80_01555 [Hespellia sp.]|nr:hypothetical protein [Hespellia sp.]
MRKQLNKKPIFLAAAALALTASLSVGSAMAYFTTYSTASGRKPLEMGFTETVPHEDVDTGGKHITIENTGDYDCFVRVRVFSVIDVTYTAGEGWEDGGDGYWYYRPVLAAGATTPSELQVGFEYPVNDENQTTESFEIMVVQECTPVVYDDEGNAMPDWEHVIRTDGTE